jgi:hypothetical protein
MQSGQAALVVLVGVGIIMLALMDTLFGGRLLSSSVSMGNSLWFGAGLVEVLLGAFRLYAEKKK